MSVRLNKPINDEYIELWKDNENIVKNIPSLYPELEKDNLLFVGINPSCPNSELKKRLKIIGSKLTPEEFKEWDSSKIEEKRVVIKNERNVAKGRYNDDKPYQYFKPFKDISKEVSMDWEHIDVFRNIAKTQKKLKDIIDISSTGKPNRDFEKIQIQIFKKLLLKLVPKIIVVQNALARDIIVSEYGIDHSDWNVGKRDNFKIFWNDEEGFHEIKLGDRNVPILFSGMLSGQRCIDKGSQKRLRWHIKEARKWVNQI